MTDHRREGRMPPRTDGFFTEIRCIFQPECLLQDSKTVASMSVSPQESRNVKCSRRKTDTWAIDPVATSCLVAVWTHGRLLSPALRFLSVALSMDKMLSYVA